MIDLDDLIDDDGFEEIIKKTKMEREEKRGEEKLLEIGLSPSDKEYIKKLKGIFYMVDYDYIKIFKINLIQDIIKIVKGKVTRKDKLFISRMDDKCDSFEIFEKWIKLQ
jgi:hypothetical protein